MVIGDLCMKHINSLITIEMNDGSMITGRLFAIGHQQIESYTAEFKTRIRLRLGSQEADLKFLPDRPISIASS